MGAANKGLNAMARTRKVGGYIGVDVGARGELGESLIPFAT